MNGPKPWSRTASGEGPWKAWQRDGGATGQQGGDLEDGDGFLTLSAPSWDSVSPESAGACAVLVVAWWAIQSFEAHRSARVDTKLAENSDPGSSRFRRGVAEVSAPLPGMEATPAKESMIPVGLRLRVVERDGAFLPLQERKSVTWADDLKSSRRVAAHPTDPDGWVQIEAPSSMVTETGLDRFHQFQAWILVLWIRTPGGYVAVDDRECGRTTTNHYVVRLDRGIRAEVW